MGIVTESEQIKEWLHHYELLQTDESRLSLFAHLKKMPDKASKMALERLIKVWLGHG